MQSVLVPVLTESACLALPTVATADSEYAGILVITEADLLCCRYDSTQKAFVCQLPESSRPEFYLHPAVVRRNDTSAKSINEWTREKTLR